MTNFNTFGYKEKLGSLGLTKDELIDFVKAHLNIWAKEEFEEEAYQNGEDSCISLEQRYTEQLDDFMYSLDQ